MNKRGFFGMIIVIVILIIMGFFWFVSNYNSDEAALIECVKASCCHASECIWEDEAPDCSEVLCSMSCEPETMDCGAGHCEVVDDECEVVWNE